MTARAKSEHPSEVSKYFAGTAGLIVALLLGYLVQQGLAVKEPAALETRVRQDAIRSSGAFWYVPVEVRNAGDRAAMAVVVETALERSADSEGNAPVASEITLDYLAGHERRLFYAILPVDPRGGQLSARVLSYQEP